MTTLRNWWSGSIITHIPTICIVTSRADIEVVFTVCTSVLILAFSESLDLSLVDSLGSSEGRFGLTSKSSSIEVSLGSGICIALVALGRISGITVSTINICAESITVTQETS